MPCPSPFGSPAFTALSAIFGTPCPQRGWTRCARRLPRPRRSRCPDGHRRPYPWARRSRRA
nr:MAG TPA: hypothetical protein [Caudoviricetes sp.]